VTLQCSCAHEFLCRRFLERPAPFSPRKIRAQKFLARAACAARRTETRRRAPSPRAARAVRSPVLYSRPRGKGCRQILCWPFLLLGHSFFRRNAPTRPRFTRVSTTAPPSAVELVVLAWKGPAAAYPDRMALCSCQGRRPQLRESLSGLRVIVRSTAQLPYVKARTSRAKKIPNNVCTWKSNVNS